MMDSPKVSVLVTFYNQEKFVDAAISSIIGQQFDQDYEILIGDDGSDDGTWDAVSKWAIDYPGIVRPFRWSRDDGVVKPIHRSSGNRVRLAEQARGEYLVFLDGDDFFPSKQKLQLQSDALDANGTCASCAHLFEYLQPDGVRKKAHVPFGGNGIIPFADFWASAYLCASCFMFRRSCFAEAAPEIDRRNFDDNTIVYALGHSGSIYYIDEVMFTYAQDASSPWSNASLSQQMIANLKDYYYEMETFGVHEKASSTRHALNLLWLFGLTKKQLDDVLPICVEEGLLKYDLFVLDYLAISEGTLFERIEREVVQAGEFAQLAYGKLIPKKLEGGNC